MAPDGRIQQKPRRKSSPDKKKDYDNYDRNCQKVELAKKATVEVVVKVKRYRNPPLNPPVAVPSAPTIYPKGSWGDLLTRQCSKESQQKRIEPERKDKYKIRRPTGCTHTHKDMRCDIVSEDDEAEIDDRPTYICRTIPLTDQLYLETHTHVRDPALAKMQERCEADGGGDNVYKPQKPDKSKKISNGNGYGKEKERSKKDRDYAAENKAIRHEIENMKLEITKITLQHKIAQQEMLNLKAQQQKNQQKYVVGFNNRATATVRSSRLQDKDLPPVSKSRNPIKHMGTSTTNLIASPPPSVNRTSRDTQADIISPVKDIAMSTPVYVQSIDDQNSKEAVLAHENEALRHEANNLLLEMQKAKLEHHDSIKTIKELHKAAERLKRENQQLITDQEQKQQLQDELLMALTENQELKTYLQGLLDKRKEISQFSHQNEDELVKLRGVIDEVRSEIEKEIQAASTSGSQHLLYKKPEALRGLDFNITEGDSVLLNDSNASREIQQILGSGPRLQPSGNMSMLSDTGTVRSRQKNLSKNGIERARYRSSTPNESSSSSSSSSGSSALSPVNPRLSSIPHDNLITSICEDVSRSFRPIQLELDLSINNKNKDTESAFGSTPKSK